MSEFDDFHRKQILLKAVASSKPTSGLTHNFYRYPARFGSEFAREAIKYFSREGDVVLDPFLGGGTSAVEALALGRKFVGSDINELSLFVANAKSSPISAWDEDAINRWVKRLPKHIGLKSPEQGDEYASRYKQHVPWRLRKTVAQSLATLQTLDSPRQIAFARCSLLGAAQWALDCKEQIPSPKVFLAKHFAYVEEMLEGMKHYREALQASGISVSSIQKHRVLLQSNADQLHKLKRSRRLGVPRLVLTSPPYLGVHVLYHRWQIQGRRETAAPYWIAGKSDGHTGVYYTFADRRSVAATKYLTRLKACFSSTSQLLDEKSKVVQLVAFSDADIQLPLYLRSLDDVGLELCETFYTNPTASLVRRDVPNRRWYASLTRQSNSSEEFLLVHRLKRKTRR